MLECLAIPSNLGTHLPDISPVQAVSNMPRLMAIRQTHPNGNHSVDAAGSCEENSVDRESNRRST